MSAIKTIVTTRERRIHASATGTLSAHGDRVAVGRTPTSTTLPLMPISHGA